MTIQVAGRDPGPVARFEEIIAKPDTMPVLVQRLSEGDTLKKIAKSWEIPYGRLSQWIVEDRERTEQYNAALKIWADAIAQECVAISDEQEEVISPRGVKFDPDVARDKLRIETRLKLAGKWDRSRYGEQTKVEHSGGISLISVLSGLREPRVIEAEDVTPALPANVPAKNSAEEMTI